MEAILVIAVLFIGADFYLRRKTGLHIHQWAIKKYQEIQNKDKEIKRITEDKQSL